MKYRVYILFLILCIMCTLPAKLHKGQGIIFTCSTYFAKGDRFQQFCKAMDSIQEKHLISRFIVINEYDALDQTDYTPLVLARYPYIEFYQKGKQDKGQARTLNMILDYIMPYTYWIHWEESWYATVPFITKSLAIMNKNMSITQLQLTPDWTDVSSSRLTHHSDHIILGLHPDFYRIKHDAYNYEYIDSTYGDEVIWPLYSLKPSVNRVSHYKKIGYFSEDPALWPYRFEYDYALRWIAAGSIKALIKPPVATRRADHVSTYH